MESAGGADPRHDLRRQDKLSDKEATDLKARLDRMDARSSHGPWTATTIKLLAAHPRKRAAELAESAGMETRHFKANVRKLKELGLTESLEVGYRLSPRGETIFQLLISNQ